MSQISIIVPIYNTEKTLAKCLDSIINQSFKDIEIICVNDGSTDSSLKISEYYANKDCRIKIINQKHSGSGSARNAGIKNSGSKYILFVNSCDWIENNLLELAYNKITQCDADITLYAYNNVTGNKIYTNQYVLDVLKYYENKKIPLNDIVDINSNIWNNIWNKIFRKDFLIDNNILFPDINLKNNDEIFNFLCLYHKPKYCCLPHSLYNHLSKKSNLYNSLQIINKKIQAYKFFISTDIFQKAPDEFKIFVINTFFKNLDNTYKQKKYQLFRLLYNYQFSQFLKYLSDITDNNLLNKTNYANMLKQHSAIKYFIGHLFSVVNTYNNYIKKKCIIIFFFKLQFQINTNKKELLCFKNNSVSKNSVLIIEANVCHGETIPGYVKMFSELGYDVDIIVTPHIYDENLFCRLDKKFYNNIFKFSVFNIEHILKFQKIKNYKFVFFNSYQLYYGDFSNIRPMPLHEIFTEMVSPQKSFIYLEHHLDKIETDKCPKNCIIQLGNIRPNITFCNSHYYGAVKQHAKNNVTQFIIVGAIESSRKSYDLLINSIQELAENHVENFHINIVGIGTIFIPPNLQQYISILGRLSFNEMYEYIEKSDFILTLMEPNNDNHLRYITDGTSGTFQLSYGFCKPVLINSVFAKKHYYNDKNSIIYDKDFTQAMIKSINMSDSEYQNYVKELSKTVKIIEDISLQNLKNILEINS